MTLTNLPQLHVLSHFFKKPTLVSLPPGASLHSLHYAGQCVFVIHGLNAAVSVATAIHTGRYFYRAFTLNVFLANTQKRV